jgi:hypothetical protein
MMIDLGWAMLQQSMARERRALEKIDKERLFALPPEEFAKEIAYREMMAQERIARQGPPKVRVNVWTSIF